MHRRSARAAIGDHTGNRRSPPCRAAVIVIDGSGVLHGRKGRRGFLDGGRRSTDHQSGQHSDEHPDPYFDGYSCVQRPRITFHGHFAVRTCRLAATCASLKNGRAHRLRNGESITVALLPFAPRKPHLSRSERRQLLIRRSLPIPIARHIGKSLHLSNCRYKGRNRNFLTLASIAQCTVARVILNCGILGAAQVGVWRSSVKVRTT